MRIEDMISDTLKKSFQLFKKDFVTLIIGTVIALFLMIFIITIPPLIFGIYYLCAQLARGKKIQISDIFKGFNYFFTSWGLFIVAFFAVIIGFILLVIPGILLMILFQYAIAVAIIENKGAINSLKRSFAIGKDNFGFTLVLWILIAVISSIGSITRIGVLLTIPFTSLCLCVATMKLTGKKSK
jgi:hypothetical protein